MSGQESQRGIPSPDQLSLLLPRKGTTGGTWKEPRSSRGPHSWAASLPLHQVPSEDNFTTSHAGPLSSKASVSSTSPRLLRHVSLEAIPTGISLSNVLSIECCISFSNILMRINVKIAGMWLNWSPTLSLSTPSKSILRQLFNQQLEKIVCRPFSKLFTTIGS